MERNGLSRSYISFFANAMFVKAALFLIVVVGLAIKATPCQAGIGVAEKAEKSLKTAAPKRKVGASSGFGVRRDPINKLRDFHKGIDISRPAGTQVFAWSDGIVARAGWMKDYGQVVDILHPNGVKTRYAHLRVMNVLEGQPLLAGQTLGQVGRTGRTTGANLHFEIMVDGKLVDPGKHLSNVAVIVNSTNN